MPGKFISYNNISPKISGEAFIAPSADIIGDVEIGSKTGIWFNCVLRGDVAEIRVGGRTNIQDGTILHVTRKSSHNPAGFPLIIGSDVTVGHQCMLHGCTLGDRILVGMGSLIMDGVIVEDDVFIGAGSVVIDDVSEHSKVVGVPAKKIKPGGDIDN